MRFGRIKLKRLFAVAAVTIAVSAFGASGPFAVPIVPEFEIHEEADHVVVRIDTGRNGVVRHNWSSAGCQNARRGLAAKSLALGDPILEADDEALSGSFRLASDSYYSNAGVRGKRWYSLDTIADVRAVPVGFRCSSDIKLRAKPGIPVNKGGSTCYFLDNCDWFHDRLSECAAYVYNSRILKNPNNPHRYSCAEDLTASYCEGVVAPWLETGPADQSSSDQSHN